MGNKKSGRFGTRIVAKDGGPIHWEKKPQRNELCHCGSGKKYKKCHLEEETFKPEPHE